MDVIFYLLFHFYWVLIPIPIIFICWRFFLILQKEESIQGKITILTFALITLVPIFWFLGGSKWFYDEKVKGLCAIDGGTRLHEKIELPSGAFNHDGSLKYLVEEQTSFTIKGDTQTTERAMGWQYISRIEVKYLKEYWPTVVRTHYKILRRDDEKLLGETVIYSRRGGDIPGPWHPSSFSCPTNFVDLKKSVFTKK